jgi:hypothetical protein
LIISGKESDALKVKRFALKGSTIRAKDMIFLSSISSKKKSDNNGSRVKFLSSDVIEETKRKLLNDFDLDAILSSNDARIISVNRICGKPDVEVIDECDKKK